MHSNITRKHISHPEINFGCNNSKVMNAETHTHLGLEFQSDGGWKSHLLDLGEKASGRINILGMLKHTLYCQSLIKKI
jgi:hypothetical protein